MVFSYFTTCLHSVIRNVHWLALRSANKAGLFYLCWWYKYQVYVALFVGTLDSCSGDGVLLIWVKEKLWQYGLNAVMLTALKQDFNKILNGWNTAAKVARILVYVKNSCTGTDLEYEHCKKYLQNMVWVLTIISCSCESSENPKLLSSLVFCSY